MSSADLGTEGDDSVSVHCVSAGSHDRLPLVRSSQSDGSWSVRRNGLAVAGSGGYARKRCPTAPELPALPDMRLKAERIHWYCPARYQ